MSRQSTAFKVPLNPGSKRYNKYARTDILTYNSLRSGLLGATVILLTYILASICVKPSFNVPRHVQAPATHGSPPLNAIARSDTPLHDSATPASVPYVENNTRKPVLVGNKPLKVALVLPFIPAQLSRLERQVSMWLESRPVTQNSSTCVPCQLGETLDHTKARPEFTLVLLVDGRVPASTNSEGSASSSIRHRLGSAASCFAGGVRIAGADVPAHLAQHPCGPCHMFYVMFDLFWGTFDYFMIMEPDVTPVRPGWLDRIADELEIASRSTLYAFWMRGSASQCDGRYGQIASRLDFHMNGNALYSLRDRGFLDFIDRVKAFYPAGYSGCSSGCATGRVYEGGYDHCFYQFLRDPANFEYARTVLRFFQHTPTIMNLCEENYNVDDVLRRFPDTYLVHSKGPYMNQSLLAVRQAMQDIWNVYTDYGSENSLARQLDSKTMTLKQLEQTMCLSQRYREVSATRPSRRCLALCADRKFRHANIEICQGYFVKRRWARFAPGKPYLWSSDLHAGPFGCNHKLYEDAGAVVHGEISFGNCKYYDMCPKRLKVLKNTGMGGYGLEPKPNAMRRAFFEAYKNDPEFQRVDAFVCSHPVAHCELYMPFNRTLIVYATTRAEFGRFDENVAWRRPFLNARSPFRWDEWVDNMRRIAAIPGNVIAANNMYDAAYIKHFTGLDAAYLPSWCGDLGVKYSPTRETILVGPYRDNLGKPHRSEADAWQHPIMRSLTEANKKSGSKFSFARLGEMYDEYTFQDIASHAAMVFMPYQASVMSFFEYYRLGLPLFAPSKSLLLAWSDDHDFVWERVYGHPRRPNSLSPSALPDPNIRKNLKYWIQFFDIYRFPHVQLFDSWEHLLKLLKTVDMKSVSRAMLAHSDAQREELRARWRDIFQTAVPPGTEGTRLMPTDFDNAMLSLYGIHKMGPDPQF